MLSRVAEHIYWMSRYFERAENIARVINVNANLLMDLPQRYKIGWKPLIEITGSEDLFEEMYQSYSEKNVTSFLISDSLSPGSILSAISSARENARTVRDILPRETWEHINDVYIYVKRQLARPVPQNRRYDFLKFIIQNVQLLTGQIMGTMTHNNAYDFLRMGRNLERADMTSRIIDVRSESLLIDETEELLPFENIQWMSLLKSMSAYQMYRQQMKTSVRREVVLEFLLKDRQFPRSFTHCLAEVQECLSYLPNNEKPIRLVMHTRRIVSDFDLTELRQQALRQFIDELQVYLADIHNAIGETYFAPAGPS
jgi:uncharacterized alpha-E superfamily protein